MKLVVIIPAYNEEESIDTVIKTIPRKIEHIEQVQVIVINDGSTDKTATVAQQAGADIIVNHSKNLGLSQSFKHGVEAALELQADIIVNTDADNQYKQTEIPQLIKPIFEEKADIVVGNRKVFTLPHMKFINKYGNLLGSTLVNLLSQTKNIDASSGFRAFNKEFAMQLSNFNYHTYTHETLITAGHLKKKIISVPVTFKERKFGKSRLISNVTKHIIKSLLLITRTMMMYHAFKVFFITGTILFLGGIIINIRYLYLYFFNSGSASGHIQSLILGLMLISIGFMTIILALLADIISINRKILEDTIFQQKKFMFFNKSN